MHRTYKTHQYGQTKNNLLIKENTHESEKTQDSPDCFHPDGLFGVFLFFALDMPNWKKLDHGKLSGLAQTSYIYDKHGNLMTEIKGTENRILTSLENIPRHTQMAFLAAEDLRFYTHKGIDIYRMLGALRSNIRSGTFSEGASTITQQLAKLTHLSAEKTIRRKLEEISIAFQIERQKKKSLKCT